MMASDKNSADKKTLGIIGGMGPLATADLFYKIIALTDADDDKGHIHILIDNNPKIPDRTKAILAGNDAPFGYILESAQKLVDMGADILLIPCNTSHVFYQRLCESVTVPIINMVEETAKHIAAMKLEKVGLLATTGTLHARLYERALEKHGIETVRPSADGQAQLMSLIYRGVKAGANTFDTAPFIDSLNEMTAKGAENFVLGCTELPVAFENYHIAFPIVDPGMILAKAAIIQAGYPVRPPAHCFCGTF